MPVSPALAEDLAAAIGELYASAEVSLIHILRTALAEDIESPLWAELKLSAVGDLRRAVETVTEALQEDADGAIARALATAYDRGAQSALADLGALPEGQRAFVRQQLPNAPAVDRLAASMTEDTRPLYQRITRVIVDAYRSIVARVSGAQILTGRTRRQASQEALDQFASRGITGFVDKAGRSWQLASYAEMAVRSVTARAVIEGHTDQLTAAGIDLVIVSDAPLNCPLCEPWEGEILTLTGSDSPHTVRARHAVTDRPRAVHVAGSLRAARAEGLMHPNCRHSLSAYLPGVTAQPESVPHPQGATYKDTQQQRYLERQVRAWKRRAAAGMDEGARRKANARVRAYQARIRELTADKGLKRKPLREQIGSAR